MNKKHKKIEEENLFSENGVQGNVTMQLADMPEELDN